MNINAIRKKVVMSLMRIAVMFVLFSFLFSLASTYLSKPSEAHQALQTSAGSSAVSPSTSATGTAEATVSAGHTATATPSPTKSPTASGNAPSLTLTVGAEELVTGPIINYLDAPFFTMPTASGLIAYSSNATTYAFTGSSLTSLALPAPSASAAQAVLSLGPQGSFDECGAWLESAYEITATHWIGWYHAEHTCNYAQGITHKSMAFAESFDGGKTWQKTGYPNNQVVTADAQYAGDPILDRAGDAKIIQQGSYFYMMYVGGDYKSYIARSLVSNQGRPGTWHKYYQGAFTEPGLGGHQTPVNALASSISFNTYLNAYLNIFISARYGFYLKISAGTDITSWTDLDGNSADSIYPLVSYPQDPNQDVWSNRTSSSGQVYGYPSMIAPDGNSSDTGRSFYLYYMKLFNGDSFNQRYLFRQAITLTLQQQPLFAAQVDLIRYQNPQTQKLRVFTEQARPAEGYQFQRIIGTLLPYPAPGFQPLYECYIPVYNDYLITNADPSQYNWQNCGDPGVPLIRNIGWASDVQTPQASLAIYRCFNPTLLNHFISTDPNCEGSHMEWRLGYIFPPPLTSNADLP